MKTKGLMRLYKYLTEAADMREPLLGQMSSVLIPMQQYSCFNSFLPGYECSNDFLLNSYELQLKINRFKINQCFFTFWTNETFPSEDQSESFVALLAFIWSVIKKQITKIENRIRFLRKKLSCSTTIKIDIRLIIRKKMNVIFKNFDDEDISITGN